ncbi:phage tail protein [Actinophytocola sp.]|uniref:phage tail protein n=1 Tax=Actinophytocola sp. TaxID=1872138 RepID=UPI002ED3A226
MALSDTSMIGLTNRFKVVMSGNNTYDIGSWAKADGLDVTWDVAEYRMGDGGNDRLYFPGNTKYTNIRLTRSVSDETEATKKWLDETATKVQLFDGYIELRDSGQKKVTSWDLRDVMPAKWSVTTFDASASQVALETLELTHRGFLNDQRMF